jgi:hypothetical protein
MTEKQRVLYHIRKSETWGFGKVSLRFRVTQSFENNQIFLNALVCKSNALAIGEKKIISKHCIVSQGTFLVSQLTLILFYVSAIRAPFPTLA